jgi:hypothetical protein
MNTAALCCSPPTPSWQARISIQGNLKTPVLRPPDPRHPRTQGMGPCRPRLCTWACSDRNCAPPSPTMDPRLHHLARALSCLPQPKRVHPVKGQRCSRPMPASSAPPMPTSSVPPAPALPVPLVPLSSVPQAPTSPVPPVLVSSVPPAPLSSTPLALASSALPTPVSFVPTAPASLVPLAPTSSVPPAPALLSSTVNPSFSVSYANSPSTGVSWCMTVGYEEPRGTHPGTHPTDE